MESSTTTAPNKDSNFVEKELAFLSEHDKQLSTVVNAFAYSRSYYANRFLKFRQWLRLFHRIPDTKPQFRSNIFVPMVYPLVSTILPRMIANKPTFRFEPREESDEKAVEQMSMLVDYQLDRMEFFKKLKMWVKDTLMYGVGIIKCYWDKNEDKEINDPDIQVIDLFDFFPDPKATQIDGGDFMIHRSIAPLTQLRKAQTYDGKPLYKNLDDIKDSTNEESSNKLYVTNDRAMSIGDIDGKLVLGSPYRQSMTKQVEILEYWGIYGKDDDEYVITVANRTTVIRAEKNPYPDGKRPFVKMEIDPNNFLFFGTGIIDPLEHLQIALNDTRNQRMDNVNLILNKLFVVLKDGDVNEQELVSRPGGVIYEGTPGAVRILETPDITQSAYQEEALLKQDAQEAVGVSDIIQGQIQDANNPGVEGQVINKTAAGAKMAVEQAGSRFKYYMQNIEDALEVFGRKLYEYNQEFMSEEKAIRILAPNDYEAMQKKTLLGRLKQHLPFVNDDQPKFQFERISPDAIKNLDLDVKVESGSTQPIEESLKQQKIMNLLGIMQNLPVTTPETFLALAEEVLTAYQTPNKDKILKTLQVPQNKGPETKISVSLKGDLNDFETSDFAKLSGASPESTDPKLTAELMAKEQHDAIAQELVKHQAKGVVDSQLEAQKHKQTLVQQEQSAQHTKEQSKETNGTGKK